VETRGVLGHIGPPKAEAWHLGTWFFWFLEPKGHSCWKGAKNPQVELVLGVETQRKPGRFEFTPTISISFDSGAPILTNVVHML
jgi:hypothetical protein